MITALLYAVNPIKPPLSTLAWGSGNALPPLGGEMVAPHRKKNAKGATSAEWMLPSLSVLQRAHEDAMMKDHSDYFVKLTSQFHEAVVQDLSKALAAPSSSSDKKSESISAAQAKLLEDILNSRTSMPTSMSQVTDFLIDRESKSDESPRHKLSVSAESAEATSDEVIEIAETVSSHVADFTAARELGDGVTAVMDSETVRNVGSEEPTLLESGPEASEEETMYPQSDSPHSAELNFPSVDCDILDLSSFDVDDQSLGLR